ncbi:sulfatase family protein [Jiulongibacter sediminis]|uniref:Arylsulfatase n=1 Tax=Jiulongibacter sediminis TaxID=1605367 RepID=A0A0P7BL20_9BACT|nr:sulfatase [Jiulongibacter sediminis]KPM47959.1 arylsulfatase [Jiulongibacter sediminis]TBX24141.1 arylsulfatase [Jiulongibacter sediminis]
MKKYFLFLPLLFLLHSAITLQKSDSPNIVLIFMDDMGYGDLSCYGASTYRTENIDRLAAEGIRFTSFLSAQAVCSASRAALMTGTYPNRMNIHGAYFPGDKVGLHPNETTIAELLKEKGYATAIYGKWHLGDEKEFLPLQQGFDEYVGIPYSNDMWPMGYDGKPSSAGWKATIAKLPIVVDNEISEYVETLEDQAKLTTLYTEKAVSFIEKNKNKPFFLYLPHSMPHVPIGVSDKFKGKSGQGLYADLMLEIDWSVGQIMQTLQKNGLEENTLVIFTSDNGPWLNYGNHAGSSGGFREGKGVSYEGGHRVPGIVRWKGHVPAGMVCNQLTSTIDLLPTISEICGTSMPANKIDGVSLKEIFDGNMDAKPREFFAYYYRRNNLEAVRKDQWKLVLPHYGRTFKGFLPGKDGYPGPSTENHEEPMALYDLRRDPGEEYDVQRMYPEIVKELEAYAETIRADIGDDLTGVEGENRRPRGDLN